VLVSHAEPAILKALGAYSPLCEEWGADFLVPCRHGWCAVQRKEVSDYVASKRDSDRISREVCQMAESPSAIDILLIEGHPARYGDPFEPRLGTFSRYEFLGDMLAWQARGVWWVNTLELEETAEFLRRLPVWLDRDDSTLLRAPKTRGATMVERILMQMPGVSLGKARKIADAYPSPVRWSVSRAELESLPGFAAKSVGKFYDQLEAP
jgi:ERCC4-type nuclease